MKNSISSLFIPLFLLVCNLPSNAQELLKTSQANRISANHNIKIDGHLNEVIWQNQAEQWSGDFTQRLPHEGAKPTAQTSFSIQYDNRFLYIAFRCDEENINDINKRMSRRDGYNGDWVEITFDSYLDQRTAFSFSVSAASVKSDKYISLNGAEEDLAWNPIWYAQSVITSSGWTAEIKIPFSQLRFSNHQDQVWGLQVQRRILRNEELSVWQRIPQDAPGWVSEFGQLLGISSIKPQRQLELQPFVVGAVNTFEKEPENPFRNQNIQTTNIGLDGKVGITNDITLDFTINPDFGQVEADPAAIALDGFQLFFQEQRPFFIENKNVFDYRFSAPIIGSQFSSDNLFYSRRIGRSPQGRVTLNPGEYNNSPNQSTILGAIKLSGKTKNGLSFGIMESLTADEYATISDGQHNRSQLIEPRTNYLVTRVLKDLNDRNTFIGGIFTSVNRADHPETSFLHRTAKTGGIDFLHQWKDRTWYLGANFISSHVSGSEEAILRTQQSIPHLFQREASHLQIDANKTSLTGTGGDIKFGKAGNGHLQMETGVTWRSPELELNDMGFMREADIIQQYSGVFYRSVNSFGAFRSASIGYQHWLNWDFEGNLNYFDWDVAINATLQNNWSGTLGYFSQPHIYSKSLLQGGPRIFLADQNGFWWALNSDSRKKFSFAYYGWTRTGGTGSLYLLENGIRFSYQPTDRLRFSLRPRVVNIRHQLQYNETVITGSDKRYIASLLDQNTLSLALRADWIISPNIVIQYYGEPFISTGQYNNFGYVDKPLSSLGDGQLYPLSILNNNVNHPEAYLVDENGDDAADYQIKNPDFSYAQFRSNLVLRWEYRPGSELFLVWSQGITDTGRPTASLTRLLRDQIFSTSLENTFLIKLTYRFHR